MYHGIQYLGYPTSLYHFYLIYEIGKFLKNILKHSSTDAQMVESAFVNKSDLINEINKLGVLHNIRREFVHSPYVYMLCCSTQTESKCEAKIIGMYSQKDNLFHIRRLESAHSCSKHTKTDIVTQQEIQKPKYSNMRLGEIVENIYSKYKTGYYGAYKAYRKLKETRHSIEQKENTINTNNTSEFASDGFFMNDQGIKSIFCDIDYTKKNSIIDGKAAQTGDEMVFECLISLKHEFENINEHIKCKIANNGFFFKHIQMGKHLRNVSELKVYSKQGRTVILGLLFDPTNDPIIQSCLISNESKSKALEAFLEWDSQVSGYEYKPFFIIDLDSDLIQVVTSANVPFFIKSRSVSFYLQDQKDDDFNACDYFTELNYGDTEFLEIDKSLYLRKYCSKAMYDLNNAHTPDFEFITSSILSLPLIDCITSFIWLISDDLKTRKNFTAEDLENKFPESIIDFLEEYNEMEPVKEYDSDIEAGYCGCGKFQENLFPCIHAFKKIRKLEKDPLLYVSSVYSKDNLLKIQDIVPVVDIKIHPQKTRIVLKKKKSEMGITDDVVDIQNDDA